MYSWYKVMSAQFEDNIERASYLLAFLLWPLPGHGGDQFLTLVDPLTTEGSEMVESRSDVVFGF